MRLFRLTIEGRHFAGFLFDQPTTAYGFFTTRWIEAENEQAAEEASVGSVRWEFADLLPKEHPKGIEPTLHLVEIEEVTEIPADAPSTGATWYPMED